MQTRRITHTLAILCSSIASLVPHAQAAKSEATNYSKKLRESSLTKADSKGSVSASVKSEEPPAQPAEKFPWRKNIVTTTFWIGEAPTKNNPVPNHMSSWDEKWATNYGGTDTPDKTKRNSEYRPAAFVPGQNPFYIALPYNDICKTGYKPEAAAKVPWFKEATENPDGHKSVLKGRWLAIRFGDKVAYAQWEDCGPFRTDHADYVFGTERPKPNLNKGAGLDVSPAVRDYLGMADTDVTDWKFVEFSEVPEGPWAKFGENNTFVQNARKDAERLAQNKASSPVMVRE